jgi:hypothetical protein
MPGKKDQYDKEDHAQYPEQEMQQDAAKTDLAWDLLNHHNGALFYFQISKKSLRIQRNFDISFVFPDQILFSFVKPEKKLSLEKCQLIDF